MPQRAEPGEVNVVSYDKLFAITSRVAGVQELLVAAQKFIAELEARSSGLRRREPD